MKAIIQVYFPCYWHTVNLESVSEEKKMCLPSFSSGNYRVCDCQLLPGTSDVRSQEDLPSYWDFSGVHSLGKR